jgi:hypothetical protein
MSKTKPGRTRAPRPSGAPVKQNLKAATQRRQALRSHYAAKYRTR